jgi:hypothetical protein
VKIVLWLGSVVLRDLRDFLLTGKLALLSTREARFTWASLVGAPVGTALEASLISDVAGGMVMAGVRLGRAVQGREVGKIRRGRSIGHTGYLSSVSDKGNHRGELVGAIRH